MGSSLRSALSLEPGEMVAFAGAGGKTTAAWRLLCELADMGEKAVFTTTTRVFKPRLTSWPGSLDPDRPLPDAVLVLEPDVAPARISQALESATVVVLAARLGERGDPAHAALSPYPAEPVKLVGPTPEALSRLTGRVADVTWLVEADGAGGRLLKAPADYEPVIPARADRVVVVAGLDAIGEPLTERTVHRSEVAARLLSVDSGATITPELLADLIGHESGGLKGIPPRAEVVVLLTQWDARLRDGDVQPIAEHLLSRDRIGRVIWAALRAPDPVVALWPCASAIR